MNSLLLKVVVRQNDIIFTPSTSTYFLHEVIHYYCPRNLHKFYMLEPTDPKGLKQHKKNRITNNVPKPELDS